MNERYETTVYQPEPVEEQPGVLDGLGYDFVSFLVWLVTIMLVILFWAVVWRPAT